MDDRQFRQLMTEFLSNQWRMFWCNVGVLVAGVIVLSLVFYLTTRGDLQTILNALAEAKQTQVSSGNSIQIAPPRTFDDNVRDVLKKQGKIE